MRHSLDCIRGTHPCDGAFVAVLTNVLTDLKEQRTVAERRTSLYALGTASAEVLVDGIFKIRFFYELTGDGTCWAQLVLCRCIQIFNARTVVATAQVAVAAYLIGMEAFNC